VTTAVEGGIADTSTASNVKDEFAGAVPTSKAKDEFAGGGTTWREATVVTARHRNDR
jgi:hypothetical protein